MPLPACQRSCPLNSRQAQGSAGLPLLLPPPPLLLLRLGLAGRGSGAGACKTQRRVRHALRAWVTAPCASRAHCRHQLPLTTATLLLPQEVEILVPNAGLALGVAPIHEMDLEDARAMIDTNGTLPMACCRAGNWGELQL